MKQKFFLLVIFSICLFSISFMFGRTTARMTTARMGFSSEQIISPQEIMSDYKISQAVNLKDYLVFGFQANDPQDKVHKSYVGVYKKSQGGFSEVYKFAPQLPLDLEVNPPTFENMWSVRDQVLVTTWGRIGADYFGTQPVVIGLENGSFKAIPFYQGNISEKPQLKASTWTTADFEIKNSFDPTNSVKTILAQEVRVNDNKVILKFITDNNCHACEHEYIYLEYPLEK